MLAVKGIENRSSLYFNILYIRRALTTLEPTVLSAARLRAAKSDFWKWAEGLDVPIVRCRVCIWFVRALFLFYSCKRPDVSVSLKSCSTGISMGSSFELTTGITFVC